MWVVVFKKEGKMEKSSQFYSENLIKTRKKRHLYLIMGVLEQYVQKPTTEWTGEDLEKVNELLNAVDLETLDIKYNSDNLNDNLTKCILCGKMSTGSVGKAGIKWKCICQECKDKEDNMLSDKLNYVSKAMLKVVNGLEGFVDWASSDDNSVKCTDCEATLSDEEIQVCGDLCFDCYRNIKIQDYQPKHPDAK